MTTEAHPEETVQEFTPADVQKYIQQWGHEEGNLIMILHQIQSDYGYVPRQLAMVLAAELDIRLARIYEVITFYHYFKLQPAGDHNVSVCTGTACYLKGAPAALDAIKKHLNIKEGETTPDRAWHLDVARCIGACGLAPTAMVDDEVVGKMTPEKITAKIDEVSQNPPSH